jgi:hypothetical protein
MPLSYRIAMINLRDNIQKFMQVLVGKMLFPRTVRRIVQDEITGEVGDRLLKGARYSGWLCCIQTIRDKITEANCYDSEHMAIVNSGLEVIAEIGKVKYNV